MDNEMKNCRPVSELAAEWEQKRPEEMAAARERVAEYIRKIKAGEIELDVKDITQHFHGNPAWD